MLTITQWNTWHCIDSKWILVRRYTIPVMMPMAENKSFFLLSLTSKLICIFISNNFHFRYSYPYTCHMYFFPSKFWMQKEAVSVLLGSVLPTYETPLVPNKKKKGLPIPHIYICNARFCVCNSFSFTLYMARGPLHNLVVWSGDLVQVVTRSIYYSLCFLLLCSLTIHFFKRWLMTSNKHSEKILNVILHGSFYFISPGDINASQRSIFFICLVNSTQAFFFF